MPKEAILTVTLNPAVDQFVKIEKLTPGTDHRAQELSLRAGGKGINVARGLQYLGVSCLAVGFAGGMNGSFLKKELTKEKIRHQFVEVNGETRLNTTIIDAKNTEVTRILPKGPRVSLAEWNSFEKRFSLWLKSCNYVIFSGSLSPGLKNSSYAELIQLAHRYNVKSVLDTSADALRPGLKAKPSIIKLNQEEADQLFNKKLNAIPKIKEAVEYLVAKGIETVIISLGSRGAVGARRGFCFWAYPPYHKAMNTVGCGDTLLAAYVAAELKEKSIEESLRFAVAAGTANTLNFRPGMIDLATVNKILKHTNLKRI